MNNYILNEIKVPISEMFVGIQGEGITTGSVALFVRLYGCNLNCKWCDSVFEKLDHEITIKDVLDRVEKEDINRVVITGGEPLLHQQFVKWLILELIRKSIYVEVETNGRQSFDFIYNLIGCRSEILLAKEYLQFNISPKLLNSGNNESYSMARCNVIDYHSYSKNMSLKFVVRCLRENDFMQDIDEINTKYGNLLSEKQYDVSYFLMPLTNNEIDLKDCIDNIKKWIHYVPFYLQRISLRTHILIYGNKRGV